MNNIKEFKQFLQRMIDSRIGIGKPFPNADAVAKIARISKRNYLNFKIKQNCEPNKDVLKKMATSLGFPADYFWYLWLYFSGQEVKHPDDAYPDFALPSDLLLLAEDNEPLFKRLILIVENNPDFFEFNFGDLHLEKAILKLESLIKAESQTNFL